MDQVSPDRREVDGIEGGFWLHPFLRFYRCSHCSPGWFASEWFEVLYGRFSDVAAEV